MKRVVGRNAAAAQRAERRADTRTLGEAADLDDAVSVARVAEEVGDVDILVNNAGIAAWGPTETFSTASFDAMFNANARAPFFLVAAFVPGMVKRWSGSIINIGSM